MFNPFPTQFFALFVVMGVTMSHWYYLAAAVFAFLCATATILESGRRRRR